MKKILALLAVLCMAGSTYAASTVQTFNSFRVSLVGTNSGQIYSFTMINPTATNFLLTVYDAPAATNTYVNAAYMQFTNYVGSVTNYDTNIFGAVFTNIYDHVSYNSNYVAAAAVTYPTLFSMYVVATNSTVVTFPNPVRYVRGVHTVGTVTNVTAVLIHDKLQ